MDLVAVLLTGLLAGGVSCAAVQGGLLAGLVARQRSRRATAPAAAAPEPAPAPAPVVSLVKASAQPVSLRKQPTPAAAPAEPLEPAARSWASDLGDDLTPVGAFLGGKLVSHAVLGALLGAVGGAVQLSYQARTGAQLAAGLFVVLLGFAQLGVPGLRRLVIAPPASWSRFVRGRARSQSAFAPGVLGLVSILVPCGATLSVEALALTSGSPAVGAATMTVFVLGTMPLFAVVGYAAKWASGRWRGRLATATGVFVIALGLITLNGGLELAGSPVSARHAAQAVGLDGTLPVGSVDSGIAMDHGGEPARAQGDGSGGSEDGKPADEVAVPRNLGGLSAANPVTMVDGKQVVLIEARPYDWNPDKVELRAGVPTTVVVRSVDVAGCTSTFVLPSRGEDHPLPVNGDTAIDLGKLKAGELGWSCASGTYLGTMHVR